MVLPSYLFYILFLLVQISWYLYHQMLDLKGEKFGNLKAIFDRFWCFELEGTPCSLKHGIIMWYNLFFVTEIYHTTFDTGG